MEEQQNAVAEEQQHICKKCLKRLPNKSYFCMYCGTDNSPTSIQVDYQRANNETLKKYTVINAKKKSIPWYLLFMLLIIDVIAINFILITNHDNIFIKVNSARFENYEKTYYMADNAYLAVKDNKIRMIGSNRKDYIDAIGEIQQYEFKDIQEVNQAYGSKIMYFQTSENTIYSLTGTSLRKIETEEEYIDIYHYLNDLESNCYNSAEHIVLRSGSYYYDPDKVEIIKIGSPEHSSNGTKTCLNYSRETVIDNNELSLKNPELVYQAYDGSKIIIRDDDELVIIDHGLVKDRLKDIKIEEDTVKFSDVKKVFYSSYRYIIIDKNNNIYIYDEIGELLDKKDETETASISTLISVMLKSTDKKAKTNLIILLVLLIVDLVFLYKLSNKSTFYKVINMSALLMIEFVLFTVFRGKGFQLNSGSEFLLLIKLLIIIYLLLIIVSTVLAQISELAIKVLDLIKFRNIISYVFTFVAIVSIFINVLNSGENGLFFVIFLLGAYWSFFSESEELDINLLITTNTYVPIGVLAVFNFVLFMLALSIFKISNYFVLLFLFVILFALYLSVRPELAKKELTGKSIKALLVIIMSLAFNFIFTLLTMDLFNKLVKDDGTIMKLVLTMGFKYILYLVVTFIFLVIVSSILRILHAIIKQVCKNTNTVIPFMIFGLISTVLFSSIIYFFPEILNLIDTVVATIFGAITK